MRHARPTRLSAEGQPARASLLEGAESLLREDGAAVAEKEHRRDSGKGGVPGGCGPWSEGAGGFEFAVCGDSLQRWPSRAGLKRRCSCMRLTGAGRVNLGRASRGEGSPQERGASRGEGHPRERGIHGRGVSRGGGLGQFQGQL